jgi:hypothetical protein
MLGISVPVHARRSHVLCLCMNAWQPWPCAVLRRANVNVPSWDHEVVNTCFCDVKSGLLACLQLVHELKLGPHPNTVARREKGLAEELRVAVPEFLAKSHVYVIMLDNFNDKSGVGVQSKHNSHVRFNVGESPAPPPFCSLHSRDCNSQLIVPPTPHMGKGGALCFGYAGA